MCRSRLMYLVLQLLRHHFARFPRITADTADKTAAPPDASLQESRLAETSSNARLKAWLVSGLSSDRLLCVVAVASSVDTSQQSVSEALPLSCARPSTLLSLAAAVSAAALNEYVTICALVGNLDSGCSTGVGEPRAVSQDDVTSRSFKRRFLLTATCAVVITLRLTSDNLLLVVPLNADKYG